MSTIPWDKISQHDRRYRQGAPRSWYEALRCFGLGQSGQQVLDLGTGPGTIACKLALQGARVAGIDISAELIVERLRPVLGDELGQYFTVNHAIEPQIYSRSTDFGG